MMNEIADDYVDGSEGKAFFFSAIYQHLATFYLLDQNGKPMGGAFYPALAAHGLENLLNPIRDVLESPLGSLTFGEVVRVFRNKALVHPSFSDADLDRIYKKVDMLKPEIQQEWEELLLRIYSETRNLAIGVARASGSPLSDFGIHNWG